MCLCMHARVCAYVCVYMYGDVCHGAQAEVRGNLVGVVSSYPVGPGDGTHVVRIAWKMPLSTSCDSQA